MALQYPPDGAMAQEMAKWEKPYHYEPYPRMLYKAARREDGVVMVLDPQNEQWSAQNYRTVKDEREEQKLLEMGWRGSPQEALDLFEAKERAIGNETANRHYHDSKMSPAAQAEAAEADRSTHRHVPEVPAKRRGRPRKQDSTA
jgi:hypothetical protein